MFVTSDLLTLFKVCSWSVTRCHTCRSNISLAIVIKPEVKYNFLSAGMFLFYILQKFSIYEDFIYFKDLFLYSSQEPKVTIDAVFSAFILQNHFMQCGQGKKGQNF
jgi:hypothetical protein